MVSKSIRRAKPEDVAALAVVIDNAYARYQDQIDDLPDVSSGLIDDVQDHDVWLVEVDGIVAGCVVLMHRDGVSLVANLAVDPQYSGSGLGRDLMALAEDRARVAHHRIMRLSTHQKMPSNITFYERQGWQESEMSPPKVIMSKVLDDR